jgi:diguanylate cyclase
MARTNRGGTPLTLMLIAASSFDGIRRRLGASAADSFLMETARVLKSTFRGSDTILRYDSTQFLVIMPGTDERQAGVALHRLSDRVDDWNLSTEEQWEMLLDSRLAACYPGSDPWQALRQAEKELQADTLPLRPPLHTNWAPSPSTTG